MKATFTFVDSHPTHTHKRHCMNCTHGCFCDLEERKHEWELYAMSMGHQCEFYNPKKESAEWL